MLFCIYCRYCSRGGTFPGTIAGGNYCWEHMDHHMNLEERVVAAEVASRRADGPGVIEVQSQLRSNVADPHVVRAAAPHCSVLRPCWFHRARFHSLVPQELPELWAMVRKFDIYRSRTYTICTVVCRNRNFWTMVRKFDISRFRRYRLGTARKSTFWVRNFLWRIALSCGEST